MGKTLRQLHFEIQHIMELSTQEIEETSKEDLSSYLEELKWNCSYIIAEKPRYEYSNNIQSNIARRIVDIEKQTSIINRTLSNRETSKNKEISTLTPHPFSDDEMLNLFNHIIKNWSYDKDLKYSYIFNEIMPEDHPPGEYEKYIRTNYKQIGKFNYNSTNSIKVKDELRQIIKSR